MSLLDSWRTSCVIHQRHRSRKMPLRFQRRFWPRLELLEGRLAPAVNVLQTDTPMLASTPYHGGGYTATLLAESAFEDISHSGATEILGDLDDSFAEANIGFDFTFFGAHHSSVFITSNGLMSFKSLPGDTGYSDYTSNDLTTNAGPNRPIIAVLWDDWITRVSEVDKIYYTTRGDAGDHRFIVQWDQVSGYSSSPSTVTFQAVLYESDASIHFRYQDVVAGDGESSHFRDFGKDATIGIRSAFPGVNSESQYAGGAGPLPVEVLGIQVAHLGGPAHIPVVHNNQSIIFVPDEGPLPPNHSPMDIALSNSSVNENLIIGTAIGTFTTSDPDNPDDSHTYHLVGGFTPNDNAQFQIVGNQLRTAAVFNYEVRQQYTIRVETRDLESAVFQREFTIDINNVNEPPTNLALSSTSINENSLLGATIGTFTTSDPDNPADSHTYHLVAGEGPNDNALFAISGNQLKANTIFDFELRQEYVVVVESRDHLGAPIQREFTILVNDVNEPPTDIALSSAHVHENLPIGTVVGAFSTTDADNPADHHDYFLVVGIGADDNSLFTISGNQLKTNAAFNFEIHRDFSILVETRDRDAVAFQKQFAIHIDDVNEAPTILAGQEFSVAEGSHAGTFIGSVSASDPDTLQVPATHLTYSIESSLFNIDPLSGQISVAEGTVLNFETGPVHVVNVRVTDNGVLSLFDLVPVTINVTNTAPTAIIVGVPLTLPEGSLLELDSDVSDPGDPPHGQNFVYSWSVTRNGEPVLAGFVTPTTGHSFSFRPANNGHYVVKLVVTDEGDASTTTTAATTVINVSPITNVGQTPTITGPRATFARTIGFTDPGADSWSVSVNYGDGASETFNLTPGNHGYDPLTKSFVVQHSYAVVTTFTVSVTVTDSDNASSTASFPVTVFTAREIGRVVGFAIGVVDDSGTVESELSAGDGTARLNASITNGAPGDNVSLSLYNSDPVPDRIASEDKGTVTRIPIQSGTETAASALPLAFVDTRVIAGNQATVTLVYEFVVPNTVANRGLRLFWWNTTLKIWQNVSGQDANGDTVEVTPILDADGNPTGNSLVRVTKTYGPNSSPSISELTGTVFSIAVPVGGGGSSTVTIALPTTFAGTSQIGDNSVAVRTTGFGSGSNLLLSLQESQSTPLSSGTGGGSIGGVGEYDISAGSGTTEQMILNWLIDGELWRERRPSNPGTDSRDPPPDQSRNTNVPGNGDGKKLDEATDKAIASAKLSKPKSVLNERTVRRPFASPSEIDEVAEATITARWRHADRGTQHALAVAAVLALATPKQSRRGRQRARHISVCTKSA